MLKLCSHSESLINYFTVESVQNRNYSYVVRMSMSSAEPRN